MTQVSSKLRACNCSTAKRKLNPWVQIWLRAMKGKKLVEGFKRGPTFRKGCLIYFKVWLSRKHIKMVERFKNWQKNKKKLFIFFKVWL